MVTAKKTPFEQAAGKLGRLKQRFFALPRSVTDAVCEIRLRAGQPITLELGNGKRIKVSNEVVTLEQISECLQEFCGHSIHSYEKQFKEGWLTIEGGHRAGFTGTAVMRDGCSGVDNVRDISSVNLRIARQFVGCAEDLYSRIKTDAGANPDEDFTGLLIIGSPMSGKTTVLRDLCRLISGGHKVSLIDERSEIAAVHNGIPTLDIGENTDVLNNFPKSQGIMCALRSLSPEYVFCDEIGFEAAELTTLSNSGIKMVLTAHSGSLRQAYACVRIRQLLGVGGISHIALLGIGKNIGKVEFYGTNKHNHDFGGNSLNHNRDSGGTLFFLPPENARGYTT
ncbi:MAG: hypothetical protein FWG83_00380 [Oscillospiraceae bacterium]|nr:hypothetical protein [Oscillospiraceae bacterium]